MFITIPMDFPQIPLTYLKIPQSSSFRKSRHPQHPIFINETVKTCDRGELLFYVLAK